MQLGRAYYVKKDTGRDEQMKKMRLWEIVKACEEGGYVGGESFVSESGRNEIFFDGEVIRGIATADIKDGWSYVEDSEAV